MDIYLLKDGKVLGPYSKAQIRHDVEAGKFQLDDSGWTEANAVLKPLAELISPEGRQSTSSDQPKPSFWRRDLTAGKFDPFWTHALSSSRLTGIILCILLGGFMLLERRSDHQAKDFNTGSSDLDKEWAKRWDELKGGRKIPVYSPLGSSGQKGTFGDLDEQLATRAREVNENTSKASTWAGLRRSREEFVSSYGEPLLTGASKVPPASVAVLFSHEDLRFAVSFWNGVAHKIDLVRTDHQPLTVEQVRWGLSAFCDGGKWNVLRSDNNGKATDWQQDGFTASLIKAYDGDAPNDEAASVYMLRVSTEEFFQEWRKLDVH